MKLLVAFLAATVAVATCSDHYNNTRLCSCGGKQIRGLCVLGTCYCPNIGKRYTQCMTIADCTCPSGAHAKCDFHHGVEGHQNHGHCLCVRDRDIM